MARRLFEQSEETTPGNLSDRLAYGRNGVPTKNITWTNIVAWLNSALSFLKSSSNLSDVDDVAAARTNLDVYDTTTIDDGLDLKADKSNVLEKDNTTTYTPTQDYHPATKKYVDDIIIKKGTYTIGDIVPTNVGGTDLDIRTISFGETLSTNNYIVVGHMWYDNGGTYQSGDDNIRPWLVVSRSTTSMEIAFNEDGGQTQSSSLKFQYAIIPL